NACHSGVLRGYRSSESSSGPAMQMAINQQIGDNPGWAVLSSCKPDEQSSDDYDAEHGVFTHFLLEGLRGAAPDYRGRITLLSLYSYVHSKTKDWYIERGESQHPVLLCNTAGDITLFTSPE